MKRKTKQTLRRGKGGVAVSFQNDTGKMLFVNIVTILPFQNKSYKMKKACAYCNFPIVGKQKTAKYCSDICRLRAFRSRNKTSKRGAVELHQKNEKVALNHLKNDAPQSVKSFTCCENGRFYSPTGRWGEILICDSCGSVWGRLDKIEYQEGKKIK